VGHRRGRFRHAGLALGQRWLPLITAFWLFWLRTGVYFAMASAGMTPRLAGGG
jgi:hypothetical protein